jgi:hypothetical protein
LKKCFFLCFFLYATSFYCCYGDDLEISENANIHELIEEPLFVSLGSICEAAHILRGCELRKAAFPFDWITTIDSEKFLNILEEDFEHFLDEQYMVVADRGPGPLLHTYYHAEFLHDGDFRGDLYDPTMRRLKIKYQRRIDRFRNLATYSGKVFFIRTAFPSSTTDPHRYYFCADNLEISDDYAWRLYHLLKERFPLLDFSLIILNTHKGQEVYEEERLAPDLIKVRGNPAIEIPQKWELYKKLFNSIVSSQLTPSLHNHSTL